MPFTPFHMGPGLAIKAVMQGCFSLMIFGWAQILMDLQPLIVLTLDKGTLHGVTHTWAGALVIGAIASLTGKPALGAVCRWVPELLRGVSDPGWSVTVFSSLLGTLSHVFLDALMHSDMQPGWPFSDGNVLLGHVTYSVLHLVLVASGVVGAALYVCVQLVRRGDRPARD